ncbi:MAG TPA: DciA family protein [Streptosporangiaceae bacterium]|nr:DciA family protein [Streptosporangiaceae bacterium]
MDNRAADDRPVAEGLLNENPLDENPLDENPLDESPAAGEPASKAGIELAREALAQAKADALKRGALPGNQTRRSRSRASGGRSRGRTERGGDPRPFGAAIRDLLAERGWEQQAAIGGVFGNWAQIVGKEVAEHTTPISFEDGEVVIAADSATWAQQVRLLAPTLVRRLNEELGHGTVRRVKVRGPASSTGRRGGWRVR